MKVCDLLMEHAEHTRLIF